MSEYTNERLADSINARKLFIRDGYRVTGIEFDSVRNVYVFRTL